MSHQDGFEFYVFVVILVGLILLVRWVTSDKEK